MDASTWPAWFLVACVLVAALCMGVGAVRAFVAVQRVKKHAQAIVPDTLVAKALDAKDAAARLQGNLTLIEALIPRLVAAIDTSILALREIRSAFSSRP
jgi:hypothetical protein